jgi:hypothetical protein
MDEALAPDHSDQDILKAETIAYGIKAAGCTAFSPGRNDRVAGDGELARLQLLSGAPALSTAVTSPNDGRGSARLVVINGVPIGFIGVGLPSEGPVAKSLEEEVSVEAAALKSHGAKVLVAVAAVGRGEAKRIAESVPDLLAVVVGSSKSRGESNTEAPPGERIGNVVIAETANHLQSVGVLDLFVRDGSYVFADATGLERAHRRADLTRRADELHIKISNWERDKTISEADLAARRDDLSRLEADRASLDQQPAPAVGSFFRYTVKEIRESLGHDAIVEEAVARYYKAVNDHNRDIFASRMPPPAMRGQPAYVGVVVCAKCHEPAKTFWETTKHSHAYATLSAQSKEYNLDCVSCHVTGYDQPGGSSVTHVELLENVQCESCHGAGSLHAARPKVEVPDKKPKETICTQCHHPPHVELFDAKAKLTEILGPGHGF